MKIRALFLICCAACFFTGFETSSIANAQSGGNAPVPPAYVFNGQLVELIESDEYGAFAVEESDLPDFEQENRQLDGLVAEYSELTRKRGIMLVRRNGTAPQFEDGLTALRQNWRSYPVYSGDDLEKVLLNEFIVRIKDGTPAGEAERILANEGATVLRKNPHVPNQYIVTFPNKSPSEVLVTINDMAQDGTGPFKYASPNFVVLLPRQRKHESRRPETGDPGADFDIAPLSLADAWPNDDHYGSQWGLEAIRADEAWTTTTGGCDVSIAILDDGVEWDHPDFEEKVTHKWDAVWSDNDPSPIDIDYHGTSVAGVAAAVTHNEEGVAGTAWGGQIFAIRVFEGTYYDNVDDTTDVVPNIITTVEIVQNGIVDAIDAGADILNLSWWFHRDDNVQEEILRGIEDENRIFVVAVGETTADVKWPALLATDHPLISVGAVIKNEPDGSVSMLSTSNYGPHGGEVTLVAPGDQIATTDLTGGDGQSIDDYVLTVFGDTSAAAPFVSGAAALLLSWSPGATPAQVKNWLAGEAQISSSLGDNPMAYGAGVLDIAASLNEVGTTGLSLAIALDPDKRLKNGEDARVTVAVSRNGVGLSGAMIRFESQDESLVSVSVGDQLVASDCAGEAEATITGKAPAWPLATTYITASIAGESVSLLVGTGGLPWTPVAVISILLIVALVLAIRRRAA